jgi:hypothetical protein
MASVAVFLDEMAEKGWQWGERDCLLWLGLWAHRLTGIDGGKPWRGRYKTALGCARILKKSGGMVACIELGAKLCGMVRVTNPVAGDIGIVCVDDREVGSICTGKRWAVMTAHGVYFTAAEPIMSWGLR